MKNEEMKRKEKKNLVALYSKEKVRLGNHL